MNQKPKSWRAVACGGSGMAVGAALGLLFGLMLLESVVAGPLAGAAAGAAIGMIWALQRRRKRTD